MASRLSLLHPSCFDAEFKATIHASSTLCLLWCYEEKWPGTAEDVFMPQSGETMWILVWAVDIGQIVIAGFNGGCLQKKSFFRNVENVGCNALTATISSLVHVQNFKPTPSSNKNMFWKKTFWTLRAGVEIKQAFWILPLSEAEFLLTTFAQVDGYGCHLARLMHPVAKYRKVVLNNGRVAQYSGMIKLADTVIRYRLTFLDQENDCCGNMNGVGTRLNGPITWLTQRKRLVYQKCCNLWPIRHCLFCHGIFNLGAQFRLSSSWA